MTSGRVVEYRNQAYPDSLMKQDAFEKDPDSHPLSLQDSILVDTARVLGIVE